MDFSKVILVDEEDNPAGTCDKLEAHQQGQLHRAFSVFIFNRKGEMLLQQRAKNKYHSGGLWTNACCSHPAPDEKTASAVQRRLLEELGFVTPATELFSFIYKAEFENGLTEYEYDHVFSGEYEGQITPDPDEVMDYCYKAMPEIAESLSARPGNYTAWFHVAFPRIEKWWQEKYGKNKQQ